MQIFVEWKNYKIQDKTVSASKVMVKTGIITFLTVTVTSSNVILDSYYPIDQKCELLHVKRFHIFFLRLCVNTIYLGCEKSNNHETFPAMDIDCSNLCSINRHSYCYQGLCIDYKPLLKKHCSSSLTLTMCATVMKYSGSCVK